MTELGEEKISTKRKVLIRTHQETGFIVVNIATRKCGFSSDCGLTCKIAMIWNRHTNK